MKNKITKFKSFHNKGESDEQGARKAFTLRQRFTHGKLRRTTQTISLKARKDHLEHLFEAQFRFGE